MRNLDPSVLDMDYAAEADRIATRLRHIVARDLHRRGLVVAISGGIDSTTCAALAVRALGPERVFCLILPERDSSDDSAVRAGLLARHLGVRVHTQDIAPALAAIGCYQARDEAVRQVSDSDHRGMVCTKTTSCPASLRVFTVEASPFLRAPSFASSSVDDSGTWTA